MTDEELLSAFEDLTLPAGGFHHADHVRLAFLYLQRYDLLESLVRYRRGLRRFVERHGVSDKYHETVTCALVVLIHERMARGSESDWLAFASANSDLLAWRDGAFFDYYDSGVLDSELARRVFVLPGPTRRATRGTPDGGRPGSVLAAVGVGAGARG